MTKTAKKALIIKVKTMMDSSSKTTIQTSSSLVRFNSVLIFKLKQIIVATSRTSLLGMTKKIMKATRELRETVMRTTMRIIKKRKLN